MWQEEKKVEEEKRKIQSEIKNKSLNRLFIVIVHVNVHNTIIIRNNKTFNKE